jgi:hypothetical protein
MYFLELARLWWTLVLFIMVHLRNLNIETLYRRPHAARWAIAKSPMRLTYRVLRDYPTLTSIIRHSISSGSTTTPIYNTYASRRVRALMFLRFSGVNRTWHRVVLDMNSLLGLRWRMKNLGAPASSLACILSSGALSSHNDIAWRNGV